MVTFSHRMVRDKVIFKQKLENSGQQKHVGLEGKGGVLGTKGMPLQRP